MRASVVGDVAGGDELLHVAVVDRDPAQPPVRAARSARVADVDERQQLAVERVVDDDAIAVSVVPMPCWSALAWAALKISPLASAIAATTTSSVRPPGRRALVA